MDNEMVEYIEKIISEVKEEILMSEERLDEYNDKLYELKNN